MKVGRWPLARGDNRRHCIAAERSGSAGTGFAYWLHFTTLPAVAHVPSTARRPRPSHRAQPRRGKRHRPAAELADRAGEMLPAVDLHARAAHRPDALSGGLRQRVAIARALVKQPALAIADEPTARLDGHTADQVLAPMREQGQAQGAAFLIANDDARLLHRCDRVLTLRDGLVCDGDDEFTAPTVARTAARTAARRTARSAARSAARTPPHELPRMNNSALLPWIKFAALKTLRNWRRSAGGTSHVAQRLQALYSGAARFRLTEVAADKSDTLAELLLLAAGAAPAPAPALAA